MILTGLPGVTSFWSNRQWKFGPNDRATTMEALQSRQVCAFLASPNGVPPQDLIYVWPTEQMDEGYELMRNGMRAKNETQRGMLGWLEKIRERALFFDRAMEAPIGRNAYPKILHCLMYPEPAEHTAGKLFNMIDADQIPHCKVRPFFALLFKYCMGKKRTLTKTKLAYEWYPCSKKNRENYRVVSEQASDALWDFLDQIYLDETSYYQCLETNKRTPKDDCLSKEDLMHKWIEWARPNYVEFVEFVDSAKKSADKHRILVFKNFLWHKVSRNTNANKRLRLIKVVNRAADTADQPAHAE